MRRLLRAVAAQLTLAALGVGLPLLLARVIGNPLPGLSLLPVGDISATAIIDVCGSIAWLYWGYWALTTLAEIISVTRWAASSARHRRPLRPLHLPGLPSGHQHLVHQLVLAALLITPTVSTAALPVAHAAAHPAVSLARPPQASASRTTPAAYTDADTRTGRASPIRDAHSTAAPTHSAPSALPRTLPTGTRVYLVPETDGPATYWDLADTYLGSGEQWRRIWELNQGRHQADGTVMSSPDLLLPGWSVLLPPDARGHLPLLDTEPLAPVTVEPGDNLSALAAADGVPDWRSVWPANAGRAEPDGQHYTDPALIRPGWTVLLPQRTPTPSHPTKPTPPRTPTPQPGTPHPRTSTPPASDPPSSSPSPGGQTSSIPPASSPPQRTAAPSTASPASTTHSSATPIAAYLAVLGGGASLLAGSLYAALRRYRRRQLRHRPAGHVLAPTAPPQRAAEAALQVAGAPALSTVTVIDRALRNLVAHTTPVDRTYNGQILPLTLLTVDQDALLLEFAAEPDLPTPWTPDGEHRWRAARRDLDQLPSTEPHAAPCPTLVSAVHAAGSETLVHLAHFGALAVTGDPHRAADWLRFLVGELAHNGWSDHLTVAVAALDPDLVALNPARIAHTDDIPAAAHALDETDDLPEVLILGPGWDDDPAAADAITARVAALTDPNRASTGCLIAYRANPADEDRPKQGVPNGGDAAAATGPWTTALQVTIDADGRLHIPTLRLRGSAPQLPAADLAQYAAVFAATRSTGPDAYWPATPTNVPSASAAFATDAPKPSDRPATNTAPDDPTPTPAPPRRDRDPALFDASSLLPRPHVEYLTRTATTAADIAFLAPSVDLRVTTTPATLEATTPITGTGAPADASSTGSNHIPVEDPGLDADLAAWRDPNSRRAKLTLLGPVTLTAHGRVPDGRIAFHTEVVTYLALHPQGVSGDRFAADLWPERSFTGRDSSPKNALSIARKWLGLDPMTGTDYLPVASTAGPGGVPTYQLHGLLIDWDLFRRLRTRAQARGADGLRDLAAALNLVSGEPLSRRRLDGYGWLRNGTVLDEDALSVAVVDAAHLVATAALAEGDVTGAQHAVDVSLSVGPADDRPLLDQAAILDAQGRHGELAATVRRILDHHEAEVEEDLPPRTYEILLTHGWISS